jgi:hypothetical protein
VAAVGARLRADEGVVLWTSLRTNTDPERCSFEVVVNGSALAFTPADLVSYVRELLQGA